MLEIVQSAEERGEDWRGLSGLSIGGRNGSHEIHYATAKLLERGGLVEIRVVEYVTSEERVFLTDAGRLELEWGPR